MCSNIECHFSFSVLAPEGLNEIERYLHESGLDLSIYHSNFNNKNILKSKRNGLIELGMETSTTDTMSGSGYIYSSFEVAQEKIKLLSKVFVQGGYSHEMSVDNETGEKTMRLEHVHT